MLWIPVTVAAAAFQVARNAAQRRLMDEAGPWGATLARFLFGLPFALAFTLAAWLFDRGAAPHFSLAFQAYALAAAAAQVLATAALLVALHRAGFGVGTALKQISLPLSGLIGWVAFGDALSPLAWTGVALSTLGLVALSWLGRPAAGPISAEGRPLSGLLFAVLSGLLFGVSLNAFRHAALLLAPGHPLFASAATVSFTQAAQSVVLGLVLARFRPLSLQAALSGWRHSLAAGFCGACASWGWVFALSLAPAAAVRALGVVEAPMAAAAGRRLFAERLSLGQLAAGALTAAGVAMTALG